MCLLYASKNVGDAVEKNREKKKTSIEPLS